MFCVIYRITRKICFTEAATWGVLWKKISEIVQNSQENTVLKFLNTEISWNTFFTEHLWTTASGFVKCSVIKLKRNKSAAKKIWIFFLSLKETCMQKLYSRKSVEGCFHIHKLLIKLLQILKFEHNLLTYYLLYLQLKSDALQGTLYFNNF